MSGFIPVHTYLAAEILAAETCTIHSVCVCVCVLIQCLLDAKRQGSSTSAPLTFWVRLFFV